MCNNDQDQAPHDRNDDADSNNENPDASDVVLDLVNDTDSDSSVCDWKCVRRPLPEAGRKEVRKLSKHIVHKANKLARKYKK